MVIPSIAADPTLEALFAAADGMPHGVLHASGLWGSSAPMTGALLANRSARLILYITAHLEDADETREDIELFCRKGCELLPAWESLPGEGVAASEIHAERLRVCAILAARAAPTPAAPGIRRSSTARTSGGARKTGTAATTLVDAAAQPMTELGILVAPIQALMQPLPSRSALQRQSLHLTAGMKAPIEQANRSDAPGALLHWLVDRGFARLDRVESPGDVARRGEILDVFPPGEQNPLRVQFDDDVVESIRRIDVGSLRSIESLREITLVGLMDAQGAAGEESDVFSYLPPDAIIIIDDPVAVAEHGRILESRLASMNRLRPATHVLGRASEFAQIHLSRLGAAATSDEKTFAFDVRSLHRFEGDAPHVVSELLRLSATADVHVFCDNAGERDRLKEMLTDLAGATPSAPLPTLCLGLLHRGFEWAAARTLVVSHHELFSRLRQRRRIRRIYAGTPLDSWQELMTGDFVVHVVHGIAVYRGLSKLRKSEGGQHEEFLTLEFAEQSTVHVPCSQIDLVQKYIGAAGRKPTLSTLGGKRWGKTKQQVADSVVELAESLLRVQAIRAQASGTAYPADTHWQREFEAAFPYVETEDQLTVAAEIRSDLTQLRPMDRLVCGDVGYGKTELAMRAAFKVVEYGKQVAVLVPTTVLAEQHYSTFTQRFADYPFTIACLSRFRSSAEQKKIIEAAKKGRVDIVVGTHRLLSKDVAFANLGLAIIDEEQRFGVEHKERLRSIRATIDVLTLTATPIPRTLHMAMMGVRDISSLQTPPVDRRSIATQIRPFDRQLIREAILRELNRDGQVFFVHNFVQSIASMADTVQSIVPEASVVFAHGQMPDGQLEDIMHQFSRKQSNVLVATTIIESGIDLPSVNTIFINRAERFGLADLHQLRGRVGRSNHRAYCYLLLSPDRPPTGKAAKRIKTIEEFSELGAGFRIAMRDLEIRGAGNLLGREQSGHIAAVGYEMYCRMLEGAVRRLRNEPDKTPSAVHVDLDVSAFVPGDYVAAERLRIETYRRIASCTTIEDLSQTEKDLIDAFGPMPAPVMRLMELAEIRIHARRFGIEKIALMPPDVVFTVLRLADAEPAFLEAPGTVRTPDAKTIHVRMPPAWLEPQTLTTILRRLLAKAASKPKMKAINTAERT